MEFKLTYEGPLPSGSKARKEDKHHIREQLHPQLAKLWELPPLSFCKSYKCKNGIDYRRYSEEPDPTQFDFGSLPLVTSDVSGFEFVSIVHKSLALVAELDVSVLIPPPEMESTAHIISRDIDNKLKTLFDGLRIPRELQEIPNGWKPGSSMIPMHCLLEDDSYISRVSVSTGVCLKPINEGDVFVIIGVKVTGRMGTLHNLSLIG